MRYKLIDGKPVPAKLAPAMLAARREAEATLTSCLRNQSAVSWARRQGASLSSQEELYNGFIAGRPGFNPANPPGRSTHELRNDGVAYRGWVGMPLRYWQVGQDWSNGATAAAVVRAYKKLGFTASITYPGNPRELHHVNLRKAPSERLLNLYKPWRRGMKGRYVKRMKLMLHYINDPDNREPYFKRNEKRPKGGWGPWFDADLESALKRFQRDHGQVADGVAGVATKRQLAASYRAAKKRRGKK
jgi:hypothetical protein